VTLCPAYLSKKLSYPLPTKGGDVLRTILDVQDYLLTLSSYRQTRNHWLHVCQLMLEEADVETVTSQLQHALFIYSDLDIAAFQRMSGPPRPKQGYRI
jgi:triphosphoribosyl-dephospho-CoA synthetase